jgi:tRNA threonylcarbamoyladenosine biosynthesis protein TsaE
MDLYRLKSVEEAFNAGVEECIYHPQAYCFIEWPVWVESMLPEDTLYLYLEPTSDGRRTITISTELQRPFMLIPQ